MSDEGPPTYNAKERPLANQRRFHQAPCHSAPNASEIARSAAHYFPKAMRLIA
ncbi:hypothetical protein RSSM_01430 [Rhodopirellula sallentina SM41]|uniref:Uncharacterized protein n=1 Tax=Rhodopirellula sallentina SM41 TaxID=1263870 RepID=M5UMB8_9BACT|nr:hypothetical protein RSSM_01430 [Rhodopirellula sallentina SM41]